MVRPSVTSSTLVPPLMSRTAIQHTPASTAQAKTKPYHSGTALGANNFPARSVRKMPAAVEVTAP